MALENGSKPTPQKDVAALQAEVERLQKALADETEKRTAAEVLAKGQGLGLDYADVREVPTGKFVTVLGSDNKPLLDEKGEKVLEPTFHFKIDLPPSGGDGIFINGVPHYHGSTYQLTIGQLRVFKDQVHRSWAHERSIRGDDENERSYRRPTARILRGGEARR